MTEVNWCVYTQNKHFGMEISQDDPLPLFKYLNDQNKKINSDVDVGYLGCYALMDFCKNAFVITSPFNLDLNINWENESVWNDQFDQDFFNDNFYFRNSKEFGKNRLGISMPPKIIFFSKRPVLMEVMPFNIIYQINPFHNKLILPFGRYDIGKWIRPVNPDGEIVSGTKNIKIKHGDPLFIVRFNQDVKLKKVYENENIIRAVLTCVHLKKYKSKTPLNKSYAMAKDLLKKLNLFK